MTDFGSRTTGGPGLSRRELIRGCGAGMGALALGDLLATAQEGDPMGGKVPPFPARARRVLHLFMNGGVSQVDSFDPKPALAGYAGRPLPAPNLRTQSRTGAAMPSTYAVRRWGRMGLEATDLFPHVAELADDLCFIRSMQTDLPNHEPSLLLMNCGDGRMSRPSLGAWMTYGLGSENRNLPGFVVLCPRGGPLQGALNWQSAFLPGAYQGTHVDTQDARVERLIEHLRPPAAPAGEQRRDLDLLLELNRAHQRSRPDDARLEARIQSFELAWRMQAEATDAFDIAREPEAIRKMYGSGIQGQQMLMARRLLERGVRFVQVWTTGEDKYAWDHHEDLVKKHRALAEECDRPIAALLRDLKQRGLLEETLVVCSTEFGRTPTVQLPKATGRDHNQHGFTIWLAGAGVKKGFIHGATDEFGYRAVQDPVHVHDLHATILHLAGFDHEKFTYRYAGRDFRLTDVHGRVVREILT